MANKKRKLSELKPGTFFLYKRMLFLRINPSKDYYIPWAVRVTTGSDGCDGDSVFYPPCHNFDPNIEVTPIKVKILHR